MASMQPLDSETADDQLALEKNAGLIIGTNSSSIISKRSVERLYLPQPHFYRYFVRKPQRRSPTINRGYWLRMKAIDWVVRQFLEKQPEPNKVIINLGCGYDPLPFQWLAQDSQLCSNTKFIDVDYEELMISKREIVLNTPKMRGLIRLKEDATPGDGIQLQSEEYVALGCDLRNIKKLDRLVKSVIDVEQCLVLCIAEVSITYMATEAADAVIAWSATLSPDVTFCLLEQRSPDRPDNPFTATMLKHFKKLGTPLQSVLTYPGNHAQTQRFQAAGFSMIEAQSLWDLWADPRFLSPSQRLALDQVEPFDEWEEFALFASHYGLVVAHTGPHGLIPEQSTSRRDSIDSFASDLSTSTVSPYGSKTQWFAYQYSKNPDREGMTHHASAYTITEQDAIAVHGGVGPAGRLSSTSVYASSDAKCLCPVLPPKEIGARCCHTMTTLGNGQNILIGGRSSPSSPMKDCWLQTGKKWERIQDLPEPRFRHRAVAVVLPDNQYGVVVFGGKTSATSVATDHLMWDPKHGWTQLKSLRQDPMPRFGASFVKLGFNHGLLFGGMRQDGVICQGLWRWRLIVLDNVVAGIRFTTSTALDTSAGVYPWLARLGASYSVIRNELLVIGGVARQGCIPREYEILSVLGSFSAFGELEKEMNLRVSPVTPKMSPDVPRPFLIGHCSHRTVKETTLIVGGGATCFSFGAYWNSGSWLMCDREAGESSHWSLVKPTPPSPQHRLRSPSLTAATKGVVAVPPQAVEPVCIASDEDFTELVQASTPKILTSLDIGPCTTLWTPSYLLSKTSPSRTVVAHSSPSRTMNFQRKDFSYTNLPFHTFLQLLASDPNVHMYLRSISSTKPTQVPADLATDWPELAPDFHLPPALSVIQQPANHHSSPLRISANVNMWLHYDVMANVLFQIHGTRKLVLYPPSDLKRLSFPPGSTTSTLDVFEPASNPTEEEDRLKSIPSTHPYLATLRPGDALFIPPLWSHAGTPLSVTTPASALSPKPLDPDTQPSLLSTATFPNSNRQPTLQPSLQPTLQPGLQPSLQPTLQSTLQPTLQSTLQPTLQSTLQPTLQPTLPPTLQPNLPPNLQHCHPAQNNINISINIFFRSLPCCPSTYPAGRDVYGNRDLAAYEEGRRDLDRIFKRFTSSFSSSGQRGNTNAEATVNDTDANAEAGHQSKGKTQYATSAIPRDIAKAYLERLVDEIRLRAEAL